MIHPDGSALPPLAEPRFLAVEGAAIGLDGNRLSCFDSGAGEETVLLLHGIGSNGMGWRFVQAALARRARVVAWNAPGYFLSDFLAAEKPRAADYVAALLALMDRLGIARAHVAGSSFGSMLGILLAARHPDRVARLALLGTSRGQRWKGDAERARMIAMRRASIAEGGVALAETRWANLVAPGTGPVVEALVKQVLSATHPRGLMASAWASDAEDSLDHAPLIQAPTLIAVGSEDRVNPPEVSAVLAGAIPGARMVVQPGIGHLAKLEAPAATAAMLEGHFWP